MPIVQLGTAPLVANNPLGTPGVIYNRSTTVNVFWGTSASLAERADASILSPQTAIQIDGKSEIYCVCLSGQTATVDFIAQGQSLSQGVLTVGNAVINATITNANIDTLAQNNISLVTTFPTIVPGETYTSAIIQMPATSAGYEICLVATTLGGSDYFAADVIITHYDNFNAPITSEVFTLSNWPQNGLGYSTVRGRLYGTGIGVEIISASSSWLGNIIGGSFTAVNFTSGLYAMPVYNKDSSQIQGADMDSNLLFQNAAITGTKILAALQNYEGTAYASVYNNSATAGVVLQMQINSYSVNNGASILGVVYSPYVSQSAAVNFAISLDHYFHAYEVQVRTTGASMNIITGVTAAR
jgi:hypothetical protein